MHFGPPARTIIAKEKMIPAATASLRRNTRPVDATQVFMVTSFIASFLLTGVPYRQGEVAKSCARLPTQYGIPSVRRPMLRRKQHPPRAVHRKTSQYSTDTTGQPQLTNWI